MAAFCRWDVGRQYSSWQNIVLLRLGFCEAPLLSGTISEVVVRGCQVNLPGPALAAWPLRARSRIRRWRCECWHKTVCHGRSEYARDEDGDGFCEVHFNTVEGLRSLLRSWLRPHRASRKTSCHSISASSRSCTTPADAAKPCSAPLSQAWLRDGAVITPESNKNQVC